MDGAVKVTKPKFCRFILVVAWLTPLGSLPADVLYLDDNSHVFGRVDRENETHIFFKQRTGPGQYRDRTFHRDEVISVVTTIDTDRLRTLTPNEPHEYYDYAEELAVGKTDPEARDLARRLFLLAAYLGNADLRQSSFLGLISVSRNAKEEIRIRGLANLILADPSIDWLSKPRLDVDHDPLDSQVTKDLLGAVKSLRQGQVASARKLVDGTEIKQLMSRLRHICTWQELRNWTNDEQLTHGAFAKLLKLELALRQLEVNKDLWPTLEKPTWSEQLIEENTSVYLIRLSNVCDVDVTKTIFQNGTWKSADE